jgi:hypothetical protein
MRDGVQPRVGVSILDPFGYVPVGIATAPEVGQHGAHRGGHQKLKEVGREVGTGWAGCCDITTARPGPEHRMSFRTLRARSTRTRARWRHMRTWSAGCCVGGPRSPTRSGAPLQQRPDGMGRIATTDTSAVNRIARFLRIEASLVLRSSRRRPEMILHDGTKGAAADNDHVEVAPSSREGPRGAITSPLQRIAEEPPHIVQRERSELQA